MEKTTNYQLKKWDKQDRILMQDFNDNSDAIDAALAAQVSALAAEETARKDADTAEADARAAALAAEASAREKTDAAILDRIGLQTLYSTTLTATLGGIDVPLTGIDWKKWKCVHCVLLPKQDSGGSFKVYLNFNATYQLANSAYGGTHIVLYPLGSADGPARGVCMTSACKVFCYASLHFSALEEANFKGSFLAGTSAVLYGEPI